MENEEKRVNITVRLECRELDFVGEATIDMREVYIRALKKVSENKTVFRRLIMSMLYRMLPYLPIALEEVEIRKRMGVSKSAKNSEGAGTKEEDG